MGTPRSLRIARLLLGAAAAFAAGTAAYIAALSSDRLGAAPWLALLVLTAAGFVVANVRLESDPRRAKTLAVGAAIAMSVLGTIVGFGAGMLSFPAAGTGVLAAWAALLHPPRRRMVLAFAAYLAIGLAVSLPTLGAALLYPWSITFVLAWPIRFLVFPGGGIAVLYLALGLAAGTAILALARGRVPRAPTVGGWLVAAAGAVLGGVAATAAFVAYAVARTDTSARFELLDPVVVAVVFAGGLAAGAGALALWLRPGAFGAFAAGLGAAALFMTFTARPAATCETSGTSQATPLAWSLAAAFAPSGGGTYSGGTGGSVGGGNVTTGEIRYGDRVATFRCEGDRLVEWREGAR